MNAPDTLTKVFAEHEYLAPPAGPILAGIQQRLGRPRRQMTAVVISGAVAAVLAVGVTVAAIASRETRPQPGSPGVTASSTRGTTGPPVAPTPDVVRLGARWLPPGQVTQVTIGSAFGTQTRGWNVRAADGTTTYVLLTTIPRQSLSPTHKRGTAVDLTIAGHAAREWSVDNWYHLELLYPGSLVLSVEVETDHGAATALAAIGRHVAEQLDLVAPVALQPAFRLTYLPPGLAVRGVSVDQQTGTHYALATPAVAWADTMPQYAAVTEEASRWNPKGVQPVDGRPVRGHRAFVVTGNDYPELWVVDAVKPGVSVSIDGGVGLTSLAELYRIADGIVAG